MAPFNYSDNVDNPERTHTVLGTDEEEMIHHLAEHEARVIVINPETGEIDLEMELSSAELDLDVAGWIDYVAKKRGWKAGTRKYVCNSALGRHLDEVEQDRARVVGSA